MTIGDLDEAVGILNAMLTALLATLNGQAGRQGAELRYAIGDVQANGAALIGSATLGVPLVNCFALARIAGATLVGMDAVRTAMQALAPDGLAGIAVANAGIRFALGQEARILAATSFASSQDVFAVIAQTNAAFDAAEEFAADNRDPSTYQALIAMHAAVTRDLTTRAVSLPALVSFVSPRVLTSHALANRLYGDASRCDELVAENKVYNPGFLPLAGTALSE